MGPKAENLAPYSPYGDQRDGSARKLDGELLTVGRHTLTAASYSERSQGGDELGTLQVSFPITQANQAPEFGVGGL